MAGGTDGGVVAAGAGCAATDAATGAGLGLRAAGAPAAAGLRDVVGELGAVVMPPPPGTIRICGYASLGSIAATG